jgi:hypothetical protein
VTVTLLMDVDNGFANEVATLRAVNDIALGFDYEINRGGLHIDTARHNYVVLELDYYDAIYGFRFQQTFLSAVEWAGPI